MSKAHPVFVAHAPRIIAHAQENYEMRRAGNYFCRDAVYQQFRIPG